MNRRGFLRAALCAAGATASAMAVGKVGANAPPLQPGVQVGSAEYLALPPTVMADPTPTISLNGGLAMGQPVFFGANAPAWVSQPPAFLSEPLDAPMTLVTGPDPATGYRWTGVASVGRYAGGDWNLYVSDGADGTHEGWFPAVEGGTHFYPWGGLRSITNLSTGATLTFSGDKFPDDPIPLP